MSKDLTPTTAPAKGRFTGMAKRRADDKKLRPKVFSGPWFARLWQGIVKPIRETAAELKKVTWPTRQELITYTIIVCVFVVVIAAVVGVFDLGFTAIYKAVF